MPVLLAHQSYALTRDKGHERLSLQEQAWGSYERAACALFSIVGSRHRELCPVDTNAAFFWDVTG
jgi:hypothetical protein